ncbi:cadherin-like domain-containing protein [Myxococcus xanthus]|uniref:cadherin-like domain-containing protein n=1 Tax=Myxococcus xanthus TaxID=34 RepID=UPI001C107A6F|nr:cadherin-like domain-containing protein [Myxococcus xanthus]
MSLVLLTWLGCRSQPPPAEPLATSTSTTVTAPFDVAAVMRQVHFAYRPSGEEWSGGHSTYDVRASGEGLALTPVLAREGAPKGEPLRLGQARLQRGGVRLTTGKTQGSVDAEGRLLLEREGLSEHLSNAEDGVTQSWRLDRAPPGDGDLRLDIPVSGLSFAGSTADGLHFATARSALGFRYGHAAWVDGEGRRTELPSGYANDTIGVTVPEVLLKSSAFPITLSVVITPEQGVDLPIQGPTWGNWMHDVAVGSNGTDYLVVWFDLRDGTAPNLFGARVSSTGVVLDPAGISISSERGDRLSATVASNGADYLVVWTSTEYVENELREDIRAARVTSGGHVEDTPSILLSPDNHAERRPSVASVGPDYLVVWERWRYGAAERSIVATRVTSAGQRLAPVTLNLSDPERDHLTPSVASNGVEYLVAWLELRTTGEQALLGVRVSPQGEVVPESRRVIAGNPQGLPASPAVASNGSGFLVAWVDRQEGDARGSYCARLSSAGDVLDTAGLRISSQLPTSFDAELRVAGNDVNYLVVWEQADGIHGVIVPPEGMLGPQRVLSANTSLLRHDTPDVASNGTDFFAVWETWNVTTDFLSSTIQGTRVTGAGTVVDAPSPLLVTAASNTQSAPAVATNGTTYLVVWNDFRGGASDIIGARVSLAGELLDPQGIAIAAADFDQRTPSIASNGLDYLVLWNTRDPNVSTRSVIKGALVAGAGQVLSPTPLSFPSGAWYVAGSAAVASNGTDYLVVWESYDLGSSAVLGVRVTREGVVLDSPFLVLARAREHAWPAVTFNGEHYFVAWLNKRTLTPGEWDVHGVRVTSAGVVVDPPGRRLAAIPAEPSDLRLASNGKDALVVWRAGNAVRAARVTHEGTSLDPFGILVAQSPRGLTSARVASLGTEYLVVWRDFRNESPDTPTYRSKGDIYGARVTGAGLVREPAGIAISVSASVESMPAIVSSPLRRSAFVVYTRYDDSPSFMSQRVRGRFISFNDNEPPAAMDQGLLLPEDASLPFTLQGTDPEGLGLSYILGPAPSRGTLTGTGADYRYTPTPHFHGSDSFTYQVSDGELLSAPATVSFQVTPVNDAPSVPEPLAPSDGFESEGGLSTFRWSASTDIEGDAVSYHLEFLRDGVVSRTHVASSTTYTLPLAEALPEGRYSWRVRAVDAGNASSAPSSERVLISLPRRNLPPTASGQTASTNEDTALPLHLQGQDPEGQPLTFTVTTPPTNGVLTGHGAALTYVPRENFHGTDSLVFTVSDGAQSSTPATVSIQVMSINDAPTVPGLLAPANGVVLVEGARAALQWSPSTDVEADAVDYIVELLQAGVVIHRHVMEPAARELVVEGGLAPGDWHWRVSARDAWGAASAPSVERSLTVTPKSALPPSATPRAVDTREETRVDFVLEGHDPVGRTLMFSIESLPEHGTLGGASEYRHYTPTANFHGEDHFTFRVYNGETWSEPATVTIQVASINDVPSVPRLLAPADGAVVEGGLATFQWEASVDVDGDPLDYVLEFLQEGRVVWTFALAGTTSRELMGENERLAVGRYSWRVRAVDNQGGSSDMAPERAFTVVARVPPPDDSPGGAPKAPPASGCGCGATSGSTSAPFALALMGWLARRGARAARFPSSLLPSRRRAT